LNNTRSNSSAALTESSPPVSGEYVFELFVCGMTKKSLRTIKAVKTVLNQQFPHDYKLEIFDVFKNPQHTKQTQIMTTPTLIKKYPLPIRKISGDITSKDRILCSLKLGVQNP
jgi:circadian clock protein KaiB